MLHFVDDLWEVSSISPKQLNKVETSLSRNLLALF